MPLTSMLPHRASTRAVVLAASLTSSVFMATPAASGEVAGGGPPGVSVVSTESAYTFTSADLRMRSLLTSRSVSSVFGSSFTGSVIDVESNKAVWGRNRTTALKPASTNKLVTAHNALTVFGPYNEFTTHVRQGTGDVVVLVGAGDPGLSSAQISALADTTAADVRRRGGTKAHVWVDDSMFPAPSLAIGWRSTYVPDEVTPLRALVRDQRDLDDTSVDAGIYFRDRLRAQGLSAWYAGRTTVSSSSRSIASSRGPSVYQTVGPMLLNSSNDIAEMYHRVVAQSQRQPTTWTGAAAAQKTVLTREGLAISAGYDGSGLSRSDRISSLQLATIVDRGLDPSYPDLWPMRSSTWMPTAGRTGTLSAAYGRFTQPPSKCAAGKVWAKTGSLSDVVALAGWTTATDGRVKAFAFVVNGKQSDVALRRSIDTLAATVNGCF